MNFKAKKSLGQNFLTDRKILELIVNTVEIKGKEVLEIGPGSGNLTDYILKKLPKKMYVIEKDNNLTTLLVKKFNNEIEIINEDVLKISTDKISQKKLIVFGNLPYNISTEILSQWIINLKEKFWFDNLILMFQKEVADRIISNYDSSNYGRLSILALVSFLVIQLFIIKNNSIYIKSISIGNKINLNTIICPYYCISISNNNFIRHLNNYLIKIS